MVPKLVLVEWEDSRRPDGDWRWLDAEIAWTVVRCQSVGWLVARKPVVVLAPNIGDLDDDRRQMSGVIQIPARCVVRITPLMEGTTSSASSPAG